MASVIPTAVTTAVTTSKPSTPSTPSADGGGVSGGGVTFLNPLSGSSMIRTTPVATPNKKAKKAKTEKKERKEKKEKKKGKKRERDAERVSPKRRVESDNSESSGDEEEDEEDIIVVDDDMDNDMDNDMDMNDDSDCYLRKSPKNVEAEVQELLNGEEREKVIAMAKEHEKAERKLRQKARDELKKLTEADDKKLQGLFRRQEALAKSADVALLKQLKTQKADLERRILNQEEKSDVIALKKVEKDIKTTRVDMRNKYAPIAKERGLRYAVPKGIRKERQPVKKARVDQCCVCLEAEPNCALVPCGHLLCYGCAQKVNDCPQCRARISQKVKIHKN